PAPPSAAPPTPTQLSVPATPPPSPAPNGPVDAMATMTSAAPPPGYGPPPGQGGQGGQGYGYPQQAPGTPAYGYPQQGDPNNPYGGGYGGPGGPGGYGPPGPGGPGGRKNNQTLWIVVAAVVVLALGIGVAVFAMGGDDNDKAGGGGTETPTSEQPTEPTDDPTPTPDPTPTDDPTIGGEDQIPTEMVGAWEGEMTSSQGDTWFQRIEISEGYTGDIITTQYTVLAGTLCMESSVLESSGTVVTLNSDSIDDQWPSGANCSPWGEQTLEYSGGSLVWSAPSFGVESSMTMAEAGAGNDAMPYDIYSETWVGPDLTAETETTASAGELGVTFTNGTCTWESTMVAGGLQATQVIIGPGDAVSGGCDPLPSYRIHWTGDDPETITFSPMDGGEGEFNANLSD
ncbi:hypothetical protein EBN88_29280, partial [Streptomyces triticirhizae]